MSKDSENPSGLRKALNLTPNAKVHIKLGLLYGIGCSLVSVTLTIASLWYSTQGKIDAIKTKVDGLSEDVAAIRTDLKPVVEHTAILWDEHQRMARRIP